MRLQRRTLLISPPPKELDLGSEPHACSIKHGVLPNGLAYYIKPNKKPEMQDVIDDEALVGLVGLDGVESGEFLGVWFWHVGILSSPTPELSRAEALTLKGMTNEETISKRGGPAYRRRLQ